MSVFALPIPLSCKLCLSSSCIHSPNTPHPSTPGASFPFSLFVWYLWSGINILLIFTLQLGFPLRTFYILEDPILLQRFTTKNMLMLEYVEPKNGGNHWQSFWGGPTLQFGTMVTLLLMRSWVAWRMSMPLELVRFTFWWCLKHQH